MKLFKVIKEKRQSNKKIVALNNTSDIICSDQGINHVKEQSHILFNQFYILFYFL